jgi:hypothetical protein
MSRGTLELVLTPGGTAELCRGDVVLWGSADDEDFREEFGEDILDEEDAEEVVDYLVEHGIVSEEEAEKLVIYEESLEGGAADAQADDVDGALEGGRED